jgi:hypothetical protein
MSEQYTPAQLAQFAELIGITPDTHRHLRKFHNKVHDDRYWQQIDHEKLPPLDTPAGDDVFLAPFLRWLASEDFQPKILGGTVWFEATVEGTDSWQSVEEKHMTLALLRACQSARVPEVVAIFPTEGDPQ